MSQQLLDRGLMKLLTGAGTKFNPYALLATQGVKQAREVSTELLGYDFVGLGVKLVFYFGLAYLFAKFMEAVISATGWWLGMLKFFGASVPTSDQLPDPLIKLFTTGYQGFKFWDFVKAGAIIMVGWEAYSYYENNKKLGGAASPMTLLIFGGIESALIVTTIPELIGRIQSKNLILSASSGNVGSTFDVSISGLIPIQPVNYGWKNSTGQIVFERQINSDLDGAFSFQEQVLSSTAPGTYTIYFDQRPWNGPYYEAKFTVIQGIAV